MPDKTTFDDLEQLACGEIGLKISEFYSLTPRQFNNIVIGYKRKEEEALKLQLILNRDLEFAIVSPYLDKKHNIKSAKDYKKFYWETENEQPDKERKFKTKAEIEAIWQQKDKETKQ